MLTLTRRVTRTRSVSANRDSAAPHQGSAASGRAANMSEWISKTLRGLVRDRAQGRCEYCLLHEDDSIFRHQPDHIIAHKHGGQTTAENLAYSCALCNGLKGSDIASVDIETGLIIPLFHPRTNNWTDHFRIEEAVIVPMTPTARVTEYLL